MTNTPTIASVRGTPQQNPRYFGFKGGTWRELQKLLDEGAKLRGESKQAYQEWQEAGEEITRLERELHEQRAAALRGGPEPDAAELALEKERANLEKIRQKIGDVRRAVGLAQEDLRIALADLGPEALAEVQEKAERHLRDAEKAAQRLSEALSETDKLASVYEWLSSGGQRYATPRPASVTIDEFIYQRQRALGLVDVEVIS